MKLILVANTDWYLYNYRLALANYMRQQGFEVVLVSPAGSYTLRLEQSGFRWISWSVYRAVASPLEEVKAITQLAQIYKTERPDLVHHFTSKTVLYGTLAARLTGVRGVINSFTGRGYVFFSEEPKARLLRPFVSMFYRLVLRKAKCQNIFENSSDQEYYRLRRIISPNCYHLIPGVGVDPCKYNAVPEPPGTPIIVFAGRLLWDKGIDILTKAGRLLREQGLNFRLVLVGAPDPGNPSSINENTLQNWVTSGDAEWWGFRGDMEKVYQQCHIVVLPSFSEGVPTSLIEGASAGRPLVATDLSGCREVIREGENGFLVPIRDPAALADTLGKLLRSPSLRQQMGATGRQVVLGKFTCDIINKQTHLVYQSALAK